MLITPHFKDGVVVKSTDLERLEIYLHSLMTALSYHTSSGILYGMNFTQVGSDLVLLPGAAILESRSIVVIDSSDIISIPLDDVLHSAGTIYLYKTGVTPVTIRQNLGNVPQVVADKGTYALSTTIPSTSDRVLLGEFSFIYSSGSPPEKTGVQEFIRNSCLNSLTHTNSWSNDIYSGPLLHGTNAILPRSITNNSIALNTITEDRLAEGAVGRAAVQKKFGMAPVGTIAIFAGNSYKVTELFGLDSYHKSLTGWHLCDGHGIPYPTSPSDPFWELYQVIGTTYGGYKDLFYLPDLRGVFVRGFDDRSGSDSRDPDREGKNFGKYQEDQFRSHKHDMVRDGGGSLNTLMRGGGSGSLTLGEVCRETGGKETRPKNIAMHYIIYTGEPR